jgi:hypothetical protein
MPTVIHCQQSLHDISSHLVLGALAYLLGSTAYAPPKPLPSGSRTTPTIRGYRVLHAVGKGNKPATMPLTVSVLRVLEARRGQRTHGPLTLRPISGRPINRHDAYRMVARIAKAAGIPGTSAPTP